VVGLFYDYLTFNLLSQGKIGNRFFCMTPTHQRWGVILKSYDTNKNQSDPTTSPNCAVLMLPHYLCPRKAERLEMTGWASKAMVVFSAFG
jgi:hypothetical protein